MRPELERVSQIEAFLEGSMTPSQQEEFQRAMDQDPVLQEEVSLQRKVIDRLNHHALMQTIQTVHQEIETGQLSKPNRFKSFWIIGLLIAVIVVGMGALYYTTFSGNASAEAAILDLATVERVVEADGDDDVKAEESIPSDTESVAVSDPRPPRKASLPKHLQPSFTTYTFQAEKGADLQSTFSKAIIHVPAGALLDGKGNPVSGEVELQYREYRDAADMAFSGIPMTYNKEGTLHNFNSAGMFEIRASQAEKALKISASSPLTVDFELTEKLPDLDFYQLNAAGTQWKALQPIQIAQEFKPVPSTPRVGEIGLDSGDSLIEPPSNETVFFFGDSNPTQAVKRGKYVHWNSFAKKLRQAILDEIAYPPVAKEAQISGCVEMLLQIDESGNLESFTPINSSHPILSKATLKGFTKLQGTSMASSQQKKGPYWTLFPVCFGFDEAKVPTVFQNLPTNKTPLPTNVNRVPNQISDPGHYFPSLIRGLQVFEFGIFNCDQARMIQQRIQVRPSFVDEKGAPIVRAVSLSLIDLNLNAAFSFDPKSFYCQRDGRNVVLITTSKKKLYGISEQDFSAIGALKDGKYTLEMRDLSEEVKNVSDLRAYLLAERE